MKVLQTCTSDERNVLSTTDFTADLIITHIQLYLSPFFTVPLAFNWNHKHGSTGAPGHYQLVPPVPSQLAASLHADAACMEMLSGPLWSRKTAPTGAGLTGHVTSSVSMGGPDLLTSHIYIYLYKTAETVKHDLKSLFGASFIVSHTGCKIHGETSDGANPCTSWACSISSIWLKLTPSPLNFTDLPVQSTPFLTHRRIMHAKLSKQTSWVDIIYNIILLGLGWAIYKSIYKSFCPCPWLWD